MPDLLLHGGRAWDGLADTAEQRPVAVTGGVLARPAEDAARGIDITGCTIIPGLIEGHTHLCWNAAPDWRQVYDAEDDAARLLRMAGNARSMLAAGITTVRDLGAPTHLAVALRDAIRNGVVEGPDLLVAGAPVTVTGGHCWFLGGEADGELGVRVAVRERVRAGVDWIKVMASGGNMTPDTNVYAPQYTVDELRALVEEAHRLDRRVAAHAHGAEGIRAAVEAGVDMVEHCSFQTPEGHAKDDIVIAEIARKGIIVSPTVSVGFARWEGTERWERRSEVVRALFAAGARVLMSTDSGIPNNPHAALGGALAVMARLAGLAPIKALRLATSTSATLLGLLDRGTLEQGRRADLLVVEGDPLEDLGALDRVRLVVAGGRVLSPG
ncbi:MAG: amidohydrolase family protein [Dehalococcoidia bacterium]|nr:amidohydrolase family protein [Dehalococcoidia bacterium]